MTTIIPELIDLRWNEALDEPTLFQWRAVAELCAVSHVQEVVNGNMEFADDLATLANVAYQHYMDLQPSFDFEVSA